MLQDVRVQDKQDPALRFADLQVVLSTCMQEAIRQVELQCQERGEVVKRVWDTQTRVYEAVMHQKENELARADKEYLQEVQRVHSIYQQNLTNVQERLKMAEKLADTNARKYYTASRKVKVQTSKILLLNRLLTMRTQEIEALDRKLEQQRWLH